MKLTILSCLTAFLIVVAGGSTLAAQPSSGTIAGRVSDETGGALRGATVSITRTDSGAIRTLVTDENGRYEAVGLTPGAHTVTASSQGFAASEPSSVTVATGRAEVDLVLKVASIHAGATVIAEVTTATKIPVTSLLIPASVSSVPSELLSQQNATTLHEALENVAGATMHRDAGAIEMFFLRGFDSVGNGLLLTDGAYEPRTGINQMYNVERVEVVRGPIGFLYGGNGLAGAVNMVRKRPEGGSFQRLSFLGGSYSTAYVTADINQSSADARKRFRINAMWNTSDNHRDDKEGSAYAVNPSFTLAGERTLFNVDFEIQNTKGKNDGGIPVVLGEVPDVPRTRSFGSPFDEFTQDTSRVRANLDHRFNGNVSLNNKAYFTTQTWDNTGTLLFGAIPHPAGATLLRGYGELSQDIKVFGDQLDLMVKATTGAVRHDVVAGIEFQDLQVDASIDIGLLPPIDLRNPVETATLPIAFLPGAGTKLDLDTRVIAPYVLDTMHFSDRLHLSLGGRVDFLDQKNATTRFTQTDNAFSPFVGLLFAANDRLSVYGNYGKVFNPISLAVASGEPEPEIGIGTELGLKSRALNGRLRASVAVYTLNKDNISIVDQTGIVAQLGDQESKGLEVEVAADAGAGVNLLFAYGYTDAVLTRFNQVDPLTGAIADRSGNAPAWVPNHVFNSWLTKRFDGGLLVAAGLRYVGERFMNEANDFTVPSYTTIDSTIGYQRGRWEAVVHLKNLTDQAYETRSVNQVAVIPAPGFNVAAGLNLRF